MSCAFRATYLESCSWYGIPSPTTTRELSVTGTKRTSSTIAGSTSTCDSQTHQCPPASNVPHVRSKFGPSQSTPGPSFHTVQRLVFDLDRVHAQTVGDLTSNLRKSDPDLVDPLSHAYAPEEDPSEMLAAFVRTNRDRLRRTVENNGLLSPLITLPEAILAWERLGYDVVAARAAWEEIGLPISYLEDLVPWPLTIARLRWHRSTTV